MTGGLSRSQVVQARLAAALIVGLIVLGAVWYGISFVSLDRLWSDSFARRGGPMTFRFILQPAMAAIAALPDGMEEAASGARHISCRSCAASNRAAVAYRRGSFRP